MRISIEADVPDHMVAEEEHADQEYVTDEAQGAILRVLLDLGLDDIEITEVRG